MNARTTLLLASAASAAVFSLSFLLFMFLTARVEGARPPISAFVRIAAVTFAVALVFQVVYGGFLRSMLAPRGLFALPAVLAAYLIPALVVGLALADRPLELAGILPWAIYAVLVSTTFWAIARHG